MFRNSIFRQYLLQWSMSSIFWHRALNKTCKSGSKLMLACPMKLTCSFFFLNASPPHRFFGVAIMIPCHCPFKHSTLFFLSRFEKNSDEKPLNGREANQGCLEGSLPCNEAVQNNRGPKSGRKQQCLAKKERHQKLPNCPKERWFFLVLWTRIFMTVTVFDINL